MYMLPRGDLISSFSINFHFYTGDTQLYVAINPNDQSALSNLEACLLAVKGWMTRNFLLNVDKTEVLILGPKKQRLPLKEIPINFDNCPIKRCSAVRNLDLMQICPSVITSIMLPGSPIFTSAIYPGLDCSLACQMQRL
ncbi:hypothetical protein LDENG_00202720 [Lucifuga dentata]|nr:hypothetical protein LDENG_00202720 [Lucifuga dentata]